MMTCLQSHVHMHVLDESEDIQQAYSSGRDIYSITHHTHRSTAPPCDDGRAADDEDDDDTHISTPNKTGSGWPAAALAVALHLCNHVKQNLYQHVGALA